MPRKWCRRLSCAATRNCSSLPEMPISERGCTGSRREVSTRKPDSDTEADPLSQIRDQAPNPERLAGSAQLATKMQQALQALTPAERTAIVMRHWDGCGIDEIAEVLKSNNSATKNTVFRAVQKLRQALKPFAEGRGAARAVAES